MALAYTRTLIQPVTAQTINSGATYTSAEQDKGADALAMDVYLYIEVDGFAAAPGGNEQIIATIIPIHTTGGDGFGDQPQSFPFVADADQKYQWSIPLYSLPRYFKLSIENDTGQNTDASAVDAWIEYVKVTV